MKKNRLFLKGIVCAFLITSITILDINAQTGPGGVGNNSGAGNLKFWLRGDSVSIDTGVDTLFDLSGYNNHFVQSTPADQPTITTINGFDVLDFDGAGDYLLDDDGESYINGQSAFTLLFVIKSDNASTDKGFFIADDPGNTDDSLSIRYDITGDNGGQSNVITAGTGANGPIESSASAQSTSNQLLTFAWASNSTPEIFIDGTQDVLSYSNLIVGSISGSDKVILGKGALDDLAAEGWDGIIGEVIFFNRKLNSAERTIVENYLATRYNLTISNDEYTPADAGYIYDIVGIGIESDGDHNGSVSAGFGINEDNSTLDTDGEYVFASHDNTTNDIASINTTDVVPPVEAAWNRSWYLAKSGGANIDLRIYFDFGDGIEGGGVPQNITNYRLLYRVGTSGNYSVVTTTSQGIQSGDQIYFEVVDAELSTGYYTLGTIDQTNSPVEGSSVQTWYTLVGGNWTSSSIWTLDPSGALPNNPLSEIPDANDNVVILSGKTVTVTEDGKLTNEITVTGRLDLASTSGHNFTEIKGEGRILLSSDNFPAGDATNFISEGLGEGTVIFYGTDYSLTTNHTFYNVEVDLNNTTNILSLVADYTISGDFTIKKGTLQINDNASTTSINLLIKGITTVNTGTEFTVGTGDATHYLEFQGDVTNNGTIDFANNIQYACPSAPNTGVIKVTFTGATNNTLTCNGTTDFYRLFVDKGIDETYILSVLSTNTAYFRLFGSISGGGCIDPFDGPEGWERLALVIYNGTLKLGSNINIPRLGAFRTGTVCNEFSVPDGAKLWIDGATVSTHETGGGWRGFTLYGTLQVSDGSFTNPANTGGITYYGNVTTPGRLIITGGDIYTTQLKQADANGRLAYIQTGGNFYITALSDSRGSSAVFALPNADHVFEMSGGLVQINAINTTATNGIHILCDEGNYNITGGSFEIMLPTLDAAAHPEFEINSTVPLYNLTLTESANPNAQTLVLQDDLTILNDLTIGANTEFDADGYDLSIGGDFIFEDGATYTHGTNTTIFNGDDDSYIYVGDITTDSDITFNNFTVDKDVPVSSSENYDVVFSSVGRAATDTVARIEGDLLVNSGRLSTNIFIVSLKGDIENKGGIYGDVTNPGRIVLTGGSLPHTLTSSLIYDRSFGHIELDDANGVTVTTDVFMDQFTLTNGLMNIGDYLLTVDTNLVGGSGFSTSKMIQTSGDHSARGLKLKMDDNYTVNTTVTFPVGTPTYYNYGEIDIPGTTGSISGYLTIVPVEQYHPALRGALGGCDAEQYYWKVFISSGLEGVTNIDYTMYHSFTVGGSARAVYYDGSAWQTETLTGTYAFYPDVGFITTDCSIGKQSCFNQVSTVYSQASGDWNTDATWDVGVPAYYDYVVILPTHTVTMDADNTEVASLSIYDGGILDLEDWTGNDFTRVDGGGRIRISDDGIGNVEFPAGDFGDFVNNDTAVIEYYGGTYTVPADLSVYPSLHISGDASSVKTLPDQDLFIRNDLLIYDNVNTGVELWLNGAANPRELVILDSLVMDNSSKFVFPATTGSEKTVTIYQNIHLDADGSSDANSIEIENAAGTAEHDIVLYGDITVGASTMTFYRVTTSAVIDLTFIGDEDAYLFDESTVTNSPHNIQFNNININKSNSFDIYLEEEFDINGPVNGGTSKKALQITTGDCYITNTLTDITLSSGGGDFKIPSGSKLSIQGATINISGNNNGIMLDGELDISNLGSVLVNGGSNNYIEYTSSGYSAFTIAEGTLRVGSQIRRSIYTNEGILKFHQLHASSTIIIGENDAPEGNRGIFEILNSGSEFTQVDDANITIVRQQTSPSIAAVYLDPETATLGAGSSITIGNASTPGSQTIGLNSNINLKSIIVGSTNSPTLQVQIRELNIDEDITINSGATMDANGLALNIKGDFVNYGTFDANSNTATFNGASDQRIVGTTTFYNLTKSTSNVLGINDALTDTIYIDNEFRIESGTFCDSSNAIIVKGDIYNNSTHEYGGVGNSIEMDGADVQNLSGNGTFGMLTVSNASGVLVQTGNELTITDGLNLNGGLLDVGANLLNLGLDAQVIEGAPFSSSNMIRTNSSFTDNGVRKIYPSTAAMGGAYNFTIPIGSGSKYTPVEYKINANGNSTGAIITKAADERHPSIIEDSETPEIVDEDNVLHYHWVIKSTGISGFSADVEMQYDPADVYVNSSDYDVADYITARLLNDGSGSWNKYTADDFDEANELCLFNFVNVDDEEIEGDYTAGIDDAIPDQVPFYETNASGSWTDGSIWTPNVTGGPRGAMVRINTGDTVYMPSNFQSSYTTTINGRLEVDSTFGHRLGEVDGAGTLYTKRASLPAGYYADFFLSTGGTLEYGGTGSYDVLSTFSQINSLKFSGTGERRFPNQDVTLLGNLIIDGTDATLEVINDHNQKIYIGRDINYLTGSFDAGLGGNAIIEMNGSVAQTINGDFTGTNDFNHFIINNANGVTMSNSVDIYGNLTFTSGIITVTGTEVLSLTYFTNSISGAGSTAYVDGILSKNLGQAATFTFPVGDGGRYAPTIITNTQPSGTFDWEVEYFDANPHATMDTNSREAGLEMVSGNEYWRVEGPASGTSPLQIRWDEHSLLPAMTDDRPNNLKMAEWITTQWEIVTPATVTDGGINSGSILSDNSLDLDGNHYFTIGTTESTPLPAAGFLTLDTTICNGSTIGLRVQLTGDPNWTIYVWDGASTTTYSGIGSSPHTFNVSPVVNTTYTIDSVSDNIGVTTGATIFGSPVNVTVIPLPTAYNVTGGGAYCAGEAGVAVGLDNSDTGVNYELFVGAVSVGIWAGTGAALDFGNQTTSGTYTVEATDATGFCSQTMTGNAVVTIDPLPMANDQTPANICSSVAGENAQAVVDLTALEASINTDASGDQFEWFTDAALLNDVTATANAQTIAKTINGGANSATEDFYCVVTLIATGCSDVATVTYTLYRTPETGPEYHIENTWGN